MCRIAMDACDGLLECGFTKPLAQRKFDDIPHLIHNAALHCTILNQKLTSSCLDLMKLAHFTPYRNTHICFSLCLFIQIQLSWMQVGNINSEYVQHVHIIFTL